MLIHFDSFLVERYILPLFCHLAIDIDCLSFLRLSITLSSDSCVLRFSSPAAVNSAADCRLYSGVLCSIGVLFIVTYKPLQTTLRIIETLLFLTKCEQTMAPILAVISLKKYMYMQMKPTCFYWHLQGVSYFQFFSFRFLFLVSAPKHLSWCSSSKSTEYPTNFSENMFTLWPCTIIFHVLVIYRFRRAVSVT